MLRLIGFLLFAPILAAFMLLRLALFLPFALLFLLPVLIMRPRLILQAPRMFRYMLMAKRSGWRGCGPRGRWGRWEDRRLETVTEPVRL